MNRFILPFLFTALLPLVAPLADEPPAPASTETDRPIRVDTEEQATVRLVLLDVVVVDKQDRTVPDLTADDFEVVAGGDVVPIDTLDIACPGGALDEPRSVRHPSKRQAPSTTTDGRHIVLLLDYLHLSPMQRVEVLEQARDMVEHNAADKDAFMVAALTGGLRLEQPFTTDHEQVMKTLKRMEYDISLWNGNFRHMTENGFVQSMTALFDVLETVPRTKAVVLYSGMSDVPLDIEFRKIAAVASAARCSIYPVDASGLTTIEPGQINPAVGGG